jgi:hypothetical protein
MTMVTRRRLTWGMVAAGIALVAPAASVTPTVGAEAEVGVASVASARANPSCNDATFIYGWKGDGDKVFARDCRGNGWGVKVSVYYYNETAGEWEYHFKITDSNAGGDGGWKSKDIGELFWIKLHAYEYKDGKTRRHKWQDNCTPDCYNTWENTSSWLWRVYP